MRSKKAARTALVLIMCVLLCAAEYADSGAAEANRIFMFVDSEAYSENVGISDATMLFVDLLPRENTDLIIAFYDGSGFTRAKAFILASIKDKRAVKEYIDAGNGNGLYTRDGLNEGAGAHDTYLVNFSDRERTEGTVAEMFGAFEGYAPEITVVNGIDRLLPLIRNIYEDDYLLSQAEVVASDGVINVNAESSKISEINAVITGEDVSTIEITNPYGELKGVDDPGIYKAFGNRYALVKLILPLEGDWTIECDDAKNASILTLTELAMANVVSEVVQKDVKTEVEERGEATNVAGTRPEAVNDYEELNAASLHNKEVAALLKLRSELIVIIALSAIFLAIYFYKLFLSHPFKAQLLYSVETDNEIIDTGAISLQKTYGRFNFDNKTIGRHEEFCILFYATDNPEVIKVKNKGRSTVLMSSLPQRDSFKVRRGKALCIKTGEISVFVTFIDEGQK